MRFCRVSDREPPLILKEGFGSLLILPHGKQGICRVKKTDRFLVARTVLRMTEEQNGPSPGSVPDHGGAWD